MYDVTIAVNRKEHQIDKRQLVLIAFIGVIVAPPLSVHGSQDSIGPNGILSAGLLDFDGNPLTGADINIGQVEPNRPGLVGYDTDADCCNVDVIPSDVIVRDRGANVNESISDHAIGVAGLMISTDPSTTGVAQEATLFSGAHQAFVNDQPNPTVTLQTIASLGGVRAMNMSFGIQLEAGKTVPDGDSLMTQFMDWSAVQHDILYVKAGNELSESSIPVGTDDYNGITVAMSEKHSDGVFRKVSADNRFDFGIDGVELDPVGPRTATDLVAPGLLDVDGANGELLPLVDRTGTSLAAPHVTGTVALLQQYGEERISASSAGWKF